MILVAGATGHLGSEICSRLRVRGLRVRGMVRDTSEAPAVETLQQCGIETVRGDLKDAASLARACAGAHTVVTTVTATRSRANGDSIEATDHRGQVNLVRAAAEAGVAHYVYVSFSGQIGGDDPLTRAKRAVEDAVRLSGMTFTILRPSCFMEVWLSPHLGFDYGNATATIYGSGENPLSWISIGDVAEFAVRSLSNRAAENAVLELGGPESLSPLEAIRIFEEESGRPFTVQHVPESVLLEQKANATDSLQQSFAALMLSYAAGDPISMDETLRHFPITLQSVRDYALRVLDVPGAMTA